MPGVTATLCCFPLDVLRTRILSFPSVHQSGSPLHVLASIAREEGMSALYVGCAPALVAIVPSGAAYYGMYDMLKESHFHAVSKVTGKTLVKESSRQQRPPSSARHAKAGPSDSVLCHFAQASSKHGSIQPIHCCLEPLLGPLQRVR